MSIFIKDNSKPLYPYKLLEIHKSLFFFTLKKLSVPPSRMIESNKYNKFRGL